MAKRVEIRLTDNPSNSDNVSFNVVIPSMFWNTVTTYGFKSVATFDKTTIGATKQDTIDNFFDYLTNKYFTFEWITVTKVTNGCDILFNVPDFTNAFNTIVGDITIGFVDVIVEDFTRDNIILSRSPFNVIFQPTVLFDSATMNLKVYRGERTTDAPATSTFTLSKQVIQAGQDRIRFEISKLLNDYTKNSIPTFGGAGVHTSSIYDSVWIDAEITANYLGGSIGATTRQYLAIDSFGWHTELYNPKLKQNSLTSLNNHIFYLGSDYPLYFVTKGLMGVYVNEGTVPFTLDTDINSQIIGYVNMGAYATDETPLYLVLDYDTYQEIHFFTVKDQCRFPLYNCFFKNKHGFWQSIPFNLRNKRTLNVESSTYMPVTSVYGQYSLASHGKKTYQPTLTELISCNTDYIPEAYNLAFKELLASEFVYLENNGQYLPVNVKKNSLEYKTKTFEKLVQYTMDFEYSYNEINSVI